VIVLAGDLQASQVTGSGSIGGDRLGLEVVTGSGSIGGDRIGWCYLFIEIAKINGNSINNGCRYRKH
jgi:hypothetical protein